MVMMDEGFGGEYLNNPNRYYDFDPGVLVWGVLLKMDIERGQD